MMNLLDLLSSFSFSDILILIILLIIGIIIILILKTLINFIIPIVAAIVVWFLTSNLIYTGAAFVIVAIIQLILKRK